MKNVFLLIVVFTACCSTEKRQHKNEVSSNLGVFIKINVLESDTFELFYYENGEKTFTSKKVISSAVLGSPNTQTILFEFPKGVFPERVRFDFGNNRNQKAMRLYSIGFKYSTKNYKLNNYDINKLAPSKYLEFDKSNGLLKTKVLDGRYDPYLYSMDLTNLMDYLIEK